MTKKAIDPSKALGKIYFDGTPITADAVRAIVHKLEEITGLSGECTVVLFVENEDGLHEVLISSATTETENEYTVAVDVYGEDESSDQLFSAYVSSRNVEGYCVAGTWYDNLNEGAPFTGEVEIEVNGENVSLTEFGEQPITLATNENFKEYIYIKEEEPEPEPEDTKTECQLKNGYKLMYENGFDTTGRIIKATKTTVTADDTRVIYKKVDVGHAEVDPSEYVFIFEINGQFYGCRSGVAHTVEAAEEFSILTSDSTKVILGTDFINN